MGIPFYANLELQRIAQLVEARKQNVTTAERAALGLELDEINEGVFVWDTDLKMGFTWDGVQWVAEAIQMEGDVIFKGFIDASLPLDDVGQPQLVEPVSGYQYIVTTAGTLALTGVTFLPSTVVEVGDKVLFTSATTAYVFQRNDEQATETTLGNVRLADQPETDAGLNDTAAVTPLKLQEKLTGQQYVRGYFVVANIPALTGLTVTHNLNLVNRNAFTVNVMRNNQAINVRVDSIDENSLTLTSLVALSDANISVQGFVDPT